MTGLENYIIFELFCDIIAEQLILFYKETFQDARSINISVQTDT